MDAEGDHKAGQSPVAPDALSLHHSCSSLVLGGRHTPYPVNGWRDTLFSLPRRLLAAASSGSAGDDGGIAQSGPLPKLPVPPLEQTLERYLETVRPITGEAQWERTRATVAAFGGPQGAGPRLQERLMQRREQLDNWAYDWWLHDMYLNNQLPLPVNSNPGMVMPSRTFSSPDDAAVFAARFIVGVAEYKAMLDRRELPVERATSREKGQPLCMAQFYRLLSAHREPGRTRDRLIVRDTPGREPHIVVTCASQMYKVCVRSEEQLGEHLRQVLREAPALAPPPPVALLTAERRDVWADAREALAEDEQNRRNLEAVESALLVLSLDRPLPASFNARPVRGAGVGHSAGPRDETNMAHQMLHGGGSAANGPNRWFDKTLQVVVSLDGAVGICYEHSPAEGIAVVQIVEQAYRRAEAPPAPASPPASPPPSRASSPASEDLPPPPQLLTWAVGPPMVRRLQDAAFNLDSMVRDLDFYVYRFEGFGKQYIKECKVSPDAFIQLALQLAYFKMYGRSVATYESASTRRFLLGRVDCIRSATSEAREWAAAMAQEGGGGGGGAVLGAGHGVVAAAAAAADDDALGAGKRVTFSLVDQQKKLELFDAAIKKQTEISVQNILGHGIDIHLLGLREMAKELGEPTPEIFQDEVYKLANHFSLSTSQVSTSTDSYMGYGPVVPDGYGASYNPRPTSIIFCLSAFNSCENTSTWRFAHSLEESLYSMQQLLASRASTSANASANP